MSLSAFPFSKHSPVTIALSLYLLLFVLNILSSNSTIDPYKSLNIILNPNGTLTRLHKSPQSPPSPDPTLPNPVLSKDLTINQSNQTWARIYLPHKALNNSPLHPKLRLIVFFHGGGFIFDTAASTYFHNFSLNVANATQSVVVSVTYRLAPEHRLPAAYDDAVEALHWVKASNDDVWLRHADYSRFYLMGESAGGNIAYNAGLRAAEELDELKPLRIKGLILIQPFFGGTKRTPSELRLMNDQTLPPPITDLMWELSLPKGADRDHEYSNPTVNGGSTVLDQIALLGWRVVVFGCDGDPLVDRQRELVKLGRDKGVNVEGQFYGGGKHGIFLGDPSMSEKVYALVNSLR